MGPSIPVLVIEDDEITRISVEEALKESGFDVAGAATGEEALQMLEAPRCEFVAVVTDVNLGGTLTGWDVARRAREINDRVAILFMTGSDGHDWASKGVPDSLLLKKPFAVAQIVTGVAQLLNDANSTG